MRLLLSALLILLMRNLSGQNLTVSGYVKDAETGEALIGATISLTEITIGTITNNYGFYSLTLPATDSPLIVFSFVGYTPQIKGIHALNNIELNILLQPSLFLDEITVRSELADKNVEDARMGVIDIPLQNIKSLPALFGETDILKLVQMLPGVQSGNEGTTGFFVRGGNADQNLVLLDEATVYNPNHLFGIFSTFNSRALNNVTLIKGGFPAQYGGRLSSILDVTMKEGNNRKFSADGGIGLISSQLTLEGPIKKNKASFILSGRRSYADLLIRPFVPQNQAVNYYFYDLNAKVNWQVSSKDHLFLSGFKGLDDAMYVGKGNYSYAVRFGNSTSTLRWNHLFGQKLFSNTSLIYNASVYTLSTIQDKYLSQIYTGINDVNAKSEFQYYPNIKHNIRFGAAYTYHTFLSGGQSSTTTATVFTEIPKANPANIPAKYFSEYAIYLNDEYTISKRFAANIGLRTPGFFSKDTSYFRMEPRATLKMSTGPSSSVKASYTVMNQFLHLVPSSTASLPTDIWVPSSKNTMPQLSRQIALGYFRNFENNKWESSAEIYYKTMENQVAFREGNQLIESLEIESGLVYGKGWSYGAEFFLKKNSGRLTGWLSYTLSWTKQQFNDLNFGDPFPFKYDRRHVLSVIGAYTLNDHWILSAAFVYNTGSVYTLPSGRAYVNNGATLYEGNYFIYEKRNNFRLNAYNRLDISATYKKTRKIFKMKYDSELVFGAYNVYSRQNPYFVYLIIDANTGVPQAKQVSLLPIIPNISYNFKF